ncbi:MAG: ATP-binding cassette domain-containing protein [Cytophagales bacterium]|nr:ATP-binding cassette domain-containing protein [Cytophagales bacterium]
MVAIHNLTYQVGGRMLYEQVSLYINPKDKIGLVGLNGTGKSTLLKLIAGILAPSKGNITKSKDCSIGFLTQDLLSYRTEENIRSVAMQAFDEEVKIQQKIDAVLHQMETNYTDDLVDKLARLQEEFERLGGYAVQAKAEEVLEGIGFTAKDWERPMGEFSGGWRMRVMLAKLLLKQPSLLMLDEPTNHLDLPAIQWIENYLQNYGSAIIVVSHDRNFLDSTTQKIVEVEGRKLHVYAGDYTFYEKEKVLRAEVQQNAYANQQKKIKHIERFVERFRAKATKARQVQSRIKALERMEKIEEVPSDMATVKFNFSLKQKSGRSVAELAHVDKAFGTLELLKDANATIERGDKIALIGANGRGKSTLLRIIAGQEKTDQGERKLGHNVNMAFYAQHQLEALHWNNEILEELRQGGTQKTEIELRNMLGIFLFTKDDVFKKIKVLSGGEKSRVALAKALITEANFLLLDEPTNHLDIYAINSLAQALQQYEGTFILVAHDRYFITKVANKIWYIEDKQIKVYPGTYEAYTYWQQAKKK